MAKQPSKQQADAEQTKPAQTKQKTPDVPRATTPAKGNGPLKDYPIPVGATHFRIHGTDENSAIKDSLTLGTDANGEPFTRARVESMGDARWWDVIQEARLTVVRCTFVTYHGDKLVARMGQGPAWATQKAERSMDDLPAAAAPADEATPKGKRKVPVPEGMGGELFTTLLYLQERADERADRSATVQIGMMKDYLTATTNMVVGMQQTVSKAQKDAARQASKGATAEDLRKIIAEELDERDDDDDDEDEKAIEKKADVIASAINATGKNVQPLIELLVKKLTSS